VLHSKQAGIAESDKEVGMLRLTVSTEEYLMIGEDVRLVFLGGTGKHLRIMIDAPRDKNIVRSTVLEKKITDPEERAKLPRYYAEEEHPEKYVRKKDAKKAAEANGAGKGTGSGKGTESGKGTGSGKGTESGKGTGSGKGTEPGKAQSAGNEAGIKKDSEAIKDASPDRAKIGTPKKPGIVITCGNVKSGGR